MIAAWDAVDVQRDRFYVVVAVTVDCGTFHRNFPVIYTIPWRAQFEAVRSPRPFRMAKLDAGAS